MPQLVFDSPLTEESVLIRYTAAVADAATRHREDKDKDDGAT